ncbi:putative ATPase/DNA-binding winged helix-turn-helix (wHTH) protein [Variovorax boronicumulans]|uniref:ATPase/DNA-binding winged helix-turn-helix (WHTH) protein n=1 Tax=Variovorax boronicumulans TaxID=436515 RepID=A0AAW8CSZ0_9BURK|nr:winged helix-turn-helix domain-containing protein [Variovorax boronicumulans]MDP9890941.1 putative ATPase/DNA-binding winged helix-turn-helix (wHTH) protein [Variovorax boronicumulans]MDQ0051008.1 putative ATPase/DNA-binding winged helix-turn-helix (wHTH) protein [Variovorax boronicumulans]
MSEVRRWRFGAFSLWENAPRLERDGQPVRLGSRAIGLLVALVGRAGEVISKDELLAAVWPDTAVEEASVRVHMSILRKALGPPGAEDGCLEWIANIPLRGYRFLGRVHCELVASAVAALAAHASLPDGPAALPARVSSLVGREVEIERVLGMLATSRLVTIAGPGGVGKTSVAIRVAARHRERLQAPFGFVDLAPLTSQDHVLTTMARAIGVRGGAPDIEEAIVQRLEGQAMLLLVDNCEHVIERLSPLLGRLLAALPRLRVLATSREVLRVAGEHVFRLMPLAVQQSQPGSLAHALRSPAVQLLVERAQAAGADAFDDASSGPLTRICRQVDGIPLAIELVAARLGTQPVGELAFRLDDHMRLHSTARQPTLARHRTLAATLDWSIGLLGDAELLLFRRLSVFRAYFGIAAALSVAASALDPDVASDALLNLASKSLVVYDTDQGADSPYRLLDTTRSYAHALLVRAEEKEAVSKSHALFMLDLMGIATADLASLDADAWTQRYRGCLEDVRAALDACIGHHDDMKMAGALTVASAPLWFRLSEVSEYRDRVRAALDQVDALKVPDRLTAGRLEIALYNALWHTGGTVPEMTQACERALACALELKIKTLEFQARWGLCALNVTRGAYTPALRHAEFLSEFASHSTNAVTRNLSHRMLALASHFCGAFAHARAHAEAAADVDDAIRRNHANAFQPDARTTAMAILARTQWIQGESRLAMTTAIRCVEEAEALGHALSLCVALFWICPMAIWAREQEAARAWTDTLLQQTRSKGFAYWHAWALCYDDAMKLGEVEDAGAHIDTVAAKVLAMDEPRREMMVTFCDRWVDDDLVARAKRGEGQWSAAEVCRAAGRRMELQGNDAEAEALYLQAHALARSQGALAWERRAAGMLEGLRARATQR